METTINETKKAKLSDYISVDGLSEVLQVSTGTIYYWVSRNEIPHVYIGRHIRFSLDEVIKYFRDKTKEKSDLKKSQVSVYDSSVHKNFLRKGSLTKEYWELDEDEIKTKSSLKDRR